LLRELTGTDGEVPRYFEAVIEVQVDKGYPVELRLAAHRALIFNKAGATE